MLLRGGQPIIMSGMEEMEWHQTHGTHVFDVFDTIPLTPQPGITASLSSPIKVPPTSCDNYLIKNVLLLPHFLSNFMVSNW